jgi:hypothetical protein
MIAVVAGDGNILLPNALIVQDAIAPGQFFDIDRIGRGVYRLVRRAARPNEGLVNLLLACPEKDYFVPIESELIPKP